MFDLSTKVERFEKHKIILGILLMSEDNFLLNDLVRIQQDSASSHFLIAVHDNDRQYFQTHGLVDVDPFSAFKLVVGLLQHFIKNRFENLLKMDNLLLQKGYSLIKIKVFIPINIYL